jgi:hypothetical protein
MRTLPLSGNAPIRQDGRAVRENPPHLLTGVIAWASSGQGLLDAHTVKRPHLDIL